MNSKYELPRTKSPRHPSESSIRGLHPQTQSLISSAHKYKSSVFEQAAKVSHLTYQIGETILLRKKSESVKISEINSLKIKDTIRKLKKTLREYKRLTGKGRGLAAVQIGIPLKIAVLFIGKNIETIINPKITKKSKELFLYPEICMSANPVIAKVVRPGWVEVKYFDGEGNQKTWKNKKDLIINRVFQHEIDHMEGIINIDLVPSDKLILDSDPDFFKKTKFEKV